MAGNRVLSALELAVLLMVSAFLEEIVRETEDEYDRLDSEVEQLADGPALFRAKIMIRDLSRRLQFDSPEVEVRTVAGLVMTVLGRVACMEDIVTINNCRLNIIGLKGKSITWLRLWILGENQL